MYELFTGTTPYVGNDRSHSDRCSMSKARPNRLESMLPTSHPCSKPLFSRRWHAT